MDFYIKTKVFARLAKQANIKDENLIEAIKEIKKGLVDGNLGGNVYKKRIAVGNRGKSSGSRTIIATNLNDRWFFVFCYLKKDLENISEKDLNSFKYLSKVLLSLSEDEIIKAVSLKKMEIINDKKD
ncbi:type II toxin-antitoxin system RelE/ParE family toxin [Succinivibrio dextrinosolvens]|uniref:type II toxin-antitoxin system RelE/ParE family toxin n=1 Tax=Succinivibrio dextrinosolvens TaxID=83771 RepID=UPI0004E0BBAB|nr:type II toxin-antitoxin system RelE/ParE family toxin [Succinivibrio dextrinosolvens]